MSGFSLYTARAVKEEQYRDLLRQAEKERLMRQVQGDQRRREFPFSQALSRLGERLLAWRPHGRAPRVAVGWAAEGLLATAADGGEAKA